MAMPLQLQVAGTKVNSGTTYYVIKVSESGEQWSVEKRYKDFIALENTLDTSAGKLLHMALPEKGMIGFRHKFNIGSFNDRRRECLEQYLLFLSNQVSSVSSNGNLLRFLARPDASAAISQLPAQISALLAEPGLKLLRQVPITVKIESVTIQGPLCSPVHYHITLKSPGSSKEIEKTYVEFAQLHQSLQSKFDAQSLPFLPSLPPIKRRSAASQENLRMQLEAYLSYLCHQPLVLLDDTVWSWLVASSISMCVVRIVVARAMDDIPALIHWIKELELLLTTDDDDKCCMRPSILAAVMHPLQDTATSEETCLVVCRILERLLVKQEAGRMLLPRVPGGTGFLLKAYARGGAVASAVQVVFEACCKDREDNEEDEEDMSPRPSKKSLTAVPTPQRATAEPVSTLVSAPSHWRSQSMKNMSQLRISWPEGSQPMMTLLKHFAAHACCDGRDGTFRIGSIKSVNVWRVENPLLWTQYRNRAINLKAEHGFRGTAIKKMSPPIPTCDDSSLPSELQCSRSFDHSLNEAFVWHGTLHQNVDQIVKSGMDERLCSLQGMLGAGLYFAQDSCKSGQYAAKDRNDSHWFFLCRVMFGNPYMTTSSMSSTRRAPDTYDSVVYQPKSNFLGGHRELVVYDRHQVYPEYIVEACTR